MLTYEEGDLLKAVMLDESREIIVPHVCNDRGVMGAGFAIPLYSKWPKVKDAYLSETKSLGDTHFIEVEEKGPYITVANMIAQHGIKGHSSNKTPLRYEHLVCCMEAVLRQCHAEAAEIHCPLFGAGLAGGNWHFIETLITQIWVDNKIDVTVHYLPGQKPSNIK